MTYSVATDVCDVLAAEVSSPMPLVLSGATSQNERVQDLHCNDV